MLDCRKHSTEGYNTIYYHVALLLFANKWMRPNIHLCVPCLCTRGKSLAIQDHTKIGRVIGYLKNSVQVPLVAGTDSNGILNGSMLSLLLKRRVTERVHQRLDSLELTTQWRLTCWWNISTLLYNTFISLIDSWQETSAKLFTSQLKRRLDPEPCQFFHIVTQEFYKILEHRTLELIIYTRKYVYYKK